VVFVDECHLLWGDLCGYVWGKTDERIEVPIINERSKQTYYGAVNLSTQQCLIQAYKTGNSESTIAFLISLKPMSESQIALLWMEPVIIVPMRLGLILNRSIKDSNLRSGKLPVFASLPMHQSRIRLRIFGCKENGWCESVIFAKTLVNI